MYAIRSYYVRTDATGGTGARFVPDEEGEYILQTHFPEQTTTSDKQAVGSPVGTVMLASDSPKLTLVVTAEPQAVYPEHPLPTEYWTRPIDSQLRGWSPVAGSQLEAGAYGGDVITSYSIHYTKLYEIFCRKRMFRVNSLRFRCSK